jgi:hypothetical protein
MKRILALALAGLGLTASCMTASAQGINIQNDLPTVQERERAQALYQAECVIGRHAMIQDYIAANRATAAAASAVQAVGTAQQLLQVPAQIPAEGNE